MKNQVLICISLWVGFGVAQVDDARANPEVRSLIIEEGSIIIEEGSITVVYLSPGYTTLVHPLNNQYRYVGNTEATDAALGQLRGLGAAHPSEMFWRDLSKYWRIQSTSRIPHVVSSACHKMSGALTSHCVGTKWQHKYS